MSFNADATSYRKANSQSLDCLEVVVDKIYRTITSIWKSDSYLCLVDDDHKKKIVVHHRLLTK